MFFKLSNGTDLDWPLDKKGWLKTNEGFEARLYRFGGGRKKTMRFIIFLLVIALCIIAYKWYMCSKNKE
jgi:hypothetical protein